MTCTNQGLSTYTKLEASGQIVQELSSAQGEGDQHTDMIKSICLIFLEWGIKRKKNFCDSNLQKTLGSNSDILLVTYTIDIEKLHHPFDNTMHHI